jgi:hypothetical protein
MQRRKKGVLPSSEFEILLINALILQHLGEYVSHLYVESRESLRFYR